VEATTFAFVQFRDPVSAHYAVRLLYGVPLHGLPIKLRLAGTSRGGAGASSAPPGCTLFVRRLPLFMDEWDMWDLGRIAGPLVEASLPTSTLGDAVRARPAAGIGVRQRAEPSRGYGFLVYASRLHARHAMRVLSGVELCGQTIDVSVSARSSAGASFTTDDGSAVGDGESDEDATIFDAGGAADLDSAQVAVVRRYEAATHDAADSGAATVSSPAGASDAGGGSPPVLQRFSSGGLAELPLSRAAVIGLQKEAVRALVRSLEPACIAAASAAAAARASAAGDASGLRAGTASDARYSLASPDGMPTGHGGGSPYVAPPSIFGQAAGSAECGGAVPPPAKRSRFSDAPVPAGTGSGGTTTMSSPLGAGAAMAPGAGAAAAPPVGWMPMMPPAMPWFGMMPGWPLPLPMPPLAGAGGPPWVPPPPAGVAPAGFAWPPPVMPPPGPWMAGAGASSHA